MKEINELKEKIREWEKLKVALINRMAVSLARIASGYGKYAEKSHVIPYRIYIDTNDLRSEEIDRLLDDQMIRHVRWYIHNPRSDSNYYLLFIEYEYCLKGRKVNEKKTYVPIELEVDKKNYEILSIKTHGDEKTLVLLSLLTILNEEAILTKLMEKIRDQINEILQHIARILKTEWREINAL